MERMTVKDYDSWFYEKALDAYSELDYADFIDFANEWRAKMGKLAEEAQSAITSTIENMQQERHEKQTAVEYRRALL